MAILPPAGGPNLGNLGGKTDCERSWIEARQEPALSAKRGSARSPTRLTDVDA